MLDLIRGLTRDGVSVLSVFHDLGAVAELADSAVLLRDGQIARRAARVRILSCSTFEAILACTGAIDAFADAGGDVHRYVDLVAAILYARAAGATIADAFGRPLEFRTDLTRRWSGIVAATGDLAAELAEVIAGDRVTANPGGGELAVRSPHGGAVVNPGRETRFS